MVDVTPLLATIRAALETVGVPVFDGYVPDELGTDASGFIRPYIILWAGIGDNPAEPTLNAVHGTDSLILDFQTTAVGPLPGHARTVAGQVKDALTNLPVGTSKVRPNPDGFNQQTPITDTNVNPPRFYLPSQWRLPTN